MFMKMKHSWHRQLTTQENLRRYLRKHFSFLLVFFGFWNLKREGNFVHWLSTNLQLRDLMVFLEVGRRKGYVSWGRLFYGEDEACFAWGIRWGYWKMKAWKRRLRHGEDEGARWVVEDCSVEKTKRDLVGREWKRTIFIFCPRGTRLRRSSTPQL